MQRNYKFIKSQEKINPFKFMDDIKIFAKNENPDTNIKIYSQYIGMKFGIEKMCHANNKKGERLTAEGIELSNQETIRTL